MISTIFMTLKYQLLTSKQITLQHLRWRREAEQSLNQALGQPWVWSVSDFIFLTCAYQCGWLVLFLAISLSHWMYVVHSFFLFFPWLSCLEDRRSWAASSEGKDWHGWVMWPERARIEVIIVIIEHLHSAPSRYLLRGALCTGLWC